MIKKDEGKTAKKLFVGSFRGTTLDEAKIRSNIKSVKKVYGRNSLEILRAYLKLVEKHVKESTLIIESPEKLTNGAISSFKKYFEENYNKKLDILIKENSSLLGGLKLTLGDNQWDYSVKGKISKLKESLNA